MAKEPVEEPEGDEEESDHQTTILSITGTSTKELHFLANLSPLIDDPESIWSVIATLKHKPKVEYEVIYDVGSWLSSMDQSEVGNLFAVSMDGELHARLNGTWKVQDLKCPDGLNSVWAAGDDEIFAVGDKGAKVRLVGTKLDTVRDKKQANLNAVHGCSPRNVWAVGDEGLIVHYDGKAWSEMDSPTNYTLLAVHCASDTEVYIAGSDGMLFRSAGDDWEKIPAEDLTITGLAVFKKMVYLAAGESGVWRVGTNGVEQSTDHELHDLRTIKSRLFGVGNNTVYQYEDKDWWGGELEL